MIDPSAIWYRRSGFAVPLLPLSWVYCLVVRARRLGYRAGWLRSSRLEVPVIVVGNLTVGGTGKTPAVLRLAALLREQGWTPGIITRGYGGRADAWPQLVTAQSDPRLVGDEPVLLARRSGCTVVAGPRRAETARMALDVGGCDILLSDDGLQHYALERDIEILLIDGRRGFGNGHCLPAGPLREPASRADGVDLVLYKDGDVPGASMRLRPGSLVSLAQPDRRMPLEALRGQAVLAVAGIGDPEPFFASLESAGAQVERRPFADHHGYSAADVRSWGDQQVIMTEKDAVKCATLATEHHWYLAVEASVDQAFEASFLSKVRGLAYG